MKGLKVNVQKSEMVPIVEVNDVHSLAKILGYRIGHLPLSLSWHAVGGIPFNLESYFGKT